MAGYVRWARFAFNVVMWLFVAGVAFQIYLAGRAIQNLGGTGDFGMHAGFGILVGLLTLVIVVLALIARLPKFYIGASVLLFVLFVIQSALPSMGDSNPTIAALHPLNGFLIGLVAVIVAWRTRGYLRADASQQRVAN